MVSVQTVESYNGMWDGGGYQGNFVRWFSANAFGGINYSNTPVERSVSRGRAVAHRS